MWRDTAIDMNIDTLSGSDIEKEIDRDINFNKNMVVKN
jgi:hypothetical protein